MVKPWYKSRTLILAIFQGVIGIVAVLEAQDPSFKALGVGAILKTSVDVYLRLNTWMEIGKEE